MSTALKRAGGFATTIAFSCFAFCAFSNHFELNTTFFTREDLTFFHIMTMNSHF